MLGQMTECSLCNEITWASVKETKVVAYQTCLGVLGPYYLVRAKAGLSDGWWSSLLHNMSALKAQSPTFKFQFLWVIFSLLKCEHLVMNGEFSFSPVGLLDIHTLPVERCRGEI